MEHAGRDETEREVLVRELHGVAGVVPALIASDDVEAFTEEIDDLPLAFVSPLRADDCRVPDLIVHT